MAARKAAPKKTVPKKAPATKKAAAREPTPAALLKKVATVSDSNKSVQKELRAMTKIFGENQKILVSMKGMIDALASTLEHVQRQSKQINVIEDDTQKLYAGLRQARVQSDLVGRINDQTARLEKEVTRVADEQRASGSQGLAEKVEESMNSIRNNSQMIIKMAQRIDEVRDDLRRIAGKTDSLAGIGTEMDSLREGIREMSAKSGADGRAVESLRQELGRITDGVSSVSGLGAEMETIRAAIESISAKASGIDALGVVIDGLREQFGQISSKVDAASGADGRAAKLEAKMDRIEADLGLLAKKAGEAAAVGEGLVDVRSEVTGLRQEVAGKTEAIGQEISSISDALKRQGEDAAEFRARTDRIYQELQSVRAGAARSSDNSSKEMMALLQLSKYQSSIRMSAESKYGTSAEIEAMVGQTAAIVRLFEEVSEESGGGMPLPDEVRQWATGKILDCADRWEVRFSDVYAILVNAMGRDMLKESIRIQQVRDIYGIRAVDEIKADLNIS